MLCCGCRRANKALPWATESWRLSPEVSLSTEVESLMSYPCSSEWLPSSHSGKELITLRRLRTKDMEAEGDLMKRRAPSGATESHCRNVWNCRTAKKYAIYMCTYMYKWKSCIHVHNIYTYIWVHTHIYIEDTTFSLAQCYIIMTIWYGDKPIEHRQCGIS